MPPHRPRLKALAGARANSALKVMMNPDPSNPMPTIRVIPVIDLKGGLVVRGVAGRRAEYRPVVSQLAPSARPVEVARAFRDRVGLTELYLADLDALGGAEPAWPAYAALLAQGFTLWVDAGVRDPPRAAAVRAAGVQRVVAGLETVPDVATFERILDALGPEAVVFSLDLRAGEPLGDRRGWGAADPAQIGARVLALGVRRIIVLDLARVGTHQGTGTEVLCGTLKQHAPTAEIIAGGGMRDADDLRRLAQCGASAALVASALHDGRIGREHLSG